MRSSLARKALASIMLLAQLLSVSLIVFAQQPIQEETRPRRTQDPNKEPSTSAPVKDSWRIPAAESPASVIDRATPAPGPEPKRSRVGRDGC